MAPLATKGRRGPYLAATTRAVSAPRIYFTPCYRVKVSYTLSSDGGFVCVLGRYDPPRLLGYIGKKIQASRPLVAKVRTTPTETTTTTT